MWIVLKEVNRRHDHAGSADAALCSSAGSERLLYRMQARAARDPFDGANSGPHSMQGRHKAAIDQNAIHKYRTGTTLAFTASFFGARQLQILSQDIE